MIELRPYQIEAFQNGMDALLTADKVLEVLATGLGKTTIALEIAKEFEKTLFLAHRRELIDQGAKRAKEQLGIIPGVEMASRHAKGDEPMIFASVQTLAARSLDYKPKLIIIDEAHHSVAKTYQQVLDKYPEAKVFGITATPDRADQKALGSVFEIVAYRYETPQAIEDGWLSPVIWGEASNIDELLACTAGRRTIIFTSRVQEAVDLAQEISGEAVYGTLPKRKRKEILERFKSGALDYLVNCNVLTEGFDCPEIECVAMLRNINARALWMQCLGRGLRIAPDKFDCLYLDLAMNKEHDLEGPYDALDGIYENPKTIWEGWWV
jgi:superfamily II DNA or RNA helicase